MEYLSWVFILTLASIFWNHTTVEHRISEASLHCGITRAASFSNLINTFVSEMNVILRYNKTSQLIYVLAQCHRDLSQNDCLFCFAASRTRLPRCLPALEGRLYLDGCFLRYHNYAFYNESVDTSLDKVNCSSAGLGRVEDKVAELEFRKNVDLVLGTGLGISEVNGVFALAQCWESLSRGACRECLWNASEELRTCAPRSAEGRAMYAGCYVRYSTHKFYTDGNDQKHSRVFKDDT